MMNPCLEVIAYAPELLPPNDKYGSRLYIAKAEDGVKIGISAKLRTRLNTVSHSSGRVLLHVAFSGPCANARRIEASLHAKFKGRRLRAGEWFDATIFDEAVAFANTLKFEAPDEKGPEMAWVGTRYDPSTWVEPLLDKLRRHYPHEERRRSPRTDWRFT